MAELERLLMTYVEAERAACRAETSLHQLFKVTASVELPKMVEAGELRFEADRLYASLVQEFRAFEGRSA